MLLLRWEAGVKLLLWRRNLLDIEGHMSKLVNRGRDRQVADKHGQHPVPGQGGAARGKVSRPGPIADAGDGQVQQVPKLTRQRIPPPALRDSK